MVATTDKTVWQEVRSNISKWIWQAVSYISSLLWRLVKYISRRLWRLIKYKLFGVKDRRIIYGRIGEKQIFDYPVNRSAHTTIKGKTGFGKSGLAANLAIQNVNHGTRILFIDPHGDPNAKEDEEKGAAVEIYQRVKEVQNLIFLTVNQKHKAIGYNPLFSIGSTDTLNDLRDELMNSMFYDSLEGGFQVANRAKFLLDSAIYFHNAYVDWLMQVKGMTNQQVKTIIQTHQITINDLANLSSDPSRNPSRNPDLIDLFIQILDYKPSRYCRSDLVRQWQDIKESKKRNTFDIGLLGAIGRLGKIVSTSKAQLFFESHGFNLLDSLQKNQSVLCDISNLDPFTIAIISKLILVKVYTLHKKRILEGQTEMYVDEAANVEVPNIPNIITEGRKSKLALTLIFQFTKQFKNPHIINAILNTVVTKINFRNAESDLNAPLDKIANLKKREFIIENSRGVYENVKTMDMPPVVRPVEFVEKGTDKEELRERIMTKQTDIFNYFINV